MKLVVLVLAPSAASAFSFAGLINTAARTTQVAMQSYAEYMATKSNAQRIDSIDSLRGGIPQPFIPSGGAPQSGYAAYMASRNEAPVAAVAPVVQEPIVEEPLTGYAAYLASRANKPAASAPVAPAAKVPTYSAHSNDSTDSPWLDDDKTIVTFMVDGVPKKYRIVQ